MKLMATRLVVVYLFAVFVFYTITQDTGVSHFGASVLSIFAVGMDAYIEDRNGD